MKEGVIWVLTPCVLCTVGCMVQGWTAARSQSSRLVTRLRLSYRQRASWQGRRQGTWMNGSRLARRVFGNQTEASSIETPQFHHIAGFSAAPCAVIRALLLGGVVVLPVCVAGVSTTPLTVLPLELPKSRALTCTCLVPE